MKNRSDQVQHWSESITGTRFGGFLFVYFLSGELLLVAELRTKLL